MTAASICTCAIVDSATAARLQLVWTRVGGAVRFRAPVRRGLGRSRPGGAAVRQLKGKAQVEFHPDGVVYRLEAPLAALTA